MCALSREPSVGARRKGFKGKSHFGAELPEIFSKQFRFDPVTVVKGLFEPYKVDRLFGKQGGTAD